MRLLSQPTFVRRLPQVPNLPNTAPLNPASPKGNVYSQKQVRVTITSLFSGIFQNLLTIVLDCGVRLENVTNKPTNTVLTPPEIRLPNRNILKLPPPTCRHLSLCVSVHESLKIDSHSPASIFKNNAVFLENSKRNACLYDQALQCYNTNHRASWTKDVVRKRTSYYYAW